MLIKKTSFSLLMKKIFFTFLQNPYLRLRDFIYPLGVKDAWESLAMHGRGLWDGAKAYYTCEASTQGKGEVASKSRHLEGRKGLEERAWI